MKRSLILLLFLAISISFLSMSIEQNAYDLNYYINFYEENNMEMETGKTVEELTLISEDIISYLKGHGGNDLLKPYFNEKEILHMVDVQRLFNLNRILKYIGIGVYLLLLIYFQAF